MNKSAMSAHDPPIDPETGLAPDEAPTPLWLPLLGAALFLVGLTWIALRAGDEPSAATAEPGAAVAGEPQAVPPAEPAAEH